MLSWEYPPHNIGGLGKHVTELVPALAGEGVEVHLLTPRWMGGMAEEILLNASTVHRVEPPQAGDLADFFARAWHANLRLEEKAKELIEAAGPFDLLHAHDWLVGFAACALKHSYKMPLLATIHATEYGRSRGHLTGDMPRAIHNVEWWLTYEAWRVICCSHFMADEVGRIFQTPRDKIDVIPNGVDPGRFRRWEREDLRGFRARYAAPGERIVLFVGRIVAEKGMGVLVEAMPRVLARVPEAKFVVAGAGGEFEAARARAEALVGPKAYFAGFLADDDRDRLLQVADVAVLPSLYEPFGIVALEAMAARAPVVAAGVGGLAEVVQHNETGLLVYPGDPDSLAWGILHTLEHPHWAQARAENAYRMVTGEYSWGQIARRTIAVYRRVVEERRRTEW